MGEFRSGTISKKVSHILLERIHEALELFLAWHCWRQLFGTVSCHGKKGDLAGKTWSDRDVYNLFVDIDRSDVVMEVQRDATL